jgi:putative transport protein
MDALIQLAKTQPVAHAVLVLSLVAVAGLTLGAIKFRGIGLGSAGVLFAGILWGHFGQDVDHGILHFVKEFGLVLFVFTIGLQLGPGFFDTLRSQGWQLNSLAAATVLGGALVTALGVWLLSLDPAAAPGLFSGATTNTPSLGAAQQALASLPNFPADRADLPALAYAVSYPVGVCGIILSLLLVQQIFGIDPAQEAEAFRAARKQDAEPLERAALVVENQSLAGVKLANVPGRVESRVAVSVVQRAGSDELSTATDDTVLNVGDTLLAVGTRRGLETFTLAIGRRADVDLEAKPGRIIYRRVVVTRKDVLGKTVNELGVEALCGVAFTRVTRGDLEMTAVDDLRLAFGDVLVVVGEPAGIERASQTLGDSQKELNATQFIPFFVGIAMGVTLGVIPFPVPGLPAPVRLGLAGGPLLVAILLARMGHWGRLVWYMPTSANHAIRELGIILFLASVGLTAGQHFFATVFSPVGLQWLLCAAFITVIPLVGIGCFARSVLKLNFMTISGLMAGSTTDPPALAFAGALAQSDAPAISYAAVYPLTMLLRILTAQTLTLLLCR